MLKEHGSGAALSWLRFHSNDAALTSQHKFMPKFLIFYCASNSILISLCSVYWALKNSVCALVRVCEALMMSSLINTTILFLAVCQYFLYKNDFLNCETSTKSAKNTSLFKIYYISCRKWGEKDLKVIVGCTNIAYVRNKNNLFKKLVPFYGVHL
jgi:hypothetical protein